MVLWALARIGPLAIMWFLPGGCFGPIIWPPCFLFGNPLLLWVASLYEKVVRSSNHGTPLLFGGALETVLTTKVVPLPRLAPGEAFS